MLIPYIRDRLESGSPEISVNDYLYKWMPEVGWKSATYSYIFGMTYTYLMALMVLRMGVRRNNSSYIRAGQLSFAPLFHRSSSSKYAFIDLHHRWVELNCLNLANIYGSHCKNITWIFKATWVKRGLEINCEMLPKNFVWLSVTNKTKKFEHSLEIVKRHKPAAINY